jgi:hypothetical protein
VRVSRSLPDPYPNIEPVSPSSNRVSGKPTRILKTGDRRLSRKIRPLRPKIVKITPQRLRDVSLTRGNTARIFVTRKAHRDGTGWLTMQSAANQSPQQIPC